MTDLDKFISTEDVVEKLMYYVEHVRHEVLEGYMKAHHKDGQARSTKKQVTRRHRGTFFVIQICKNISLNENNRLRGLLQVLIFSVKTTFFIFPATATRTRFITVNFMFSRHGG
jgi:hypothetical protein